VVVLGVVLEGVELDELPLPEVLLPLMPEDELPDMPLLEGEELDVLPPELEPDLLKCASHSARDTDPSLFVSTAEKLGAEALLLALEPPLLLELDGVLDEAEPLAEGVFDCEDAGLVVDEDEDEGVEDCDDPVAAGEEDEDEDCATASVDSANSTAAVMVPTVLSMDGLS